MIVETKPLVDINEEAIKILFQRLGTINTIRFLNQLSNGYGNYVEEKEQLFGHLTIDELIDDIKRSN